MELEILSPTFFFTVRVHPEAAILFSKCDWSNSFLWFPRCGVFVIFPCFFLKLK